MKYLRYLILLLLPILMLSCIKDLEKEGIYTTTTCHGVLIEKRTNQPVAGMRVILTNGNQMPKSTVSALDGTFNIEVDATELDKQYYLLVEADSLYESRMVSLQEVGFGQKEVDLGTIYIVGPEVPVVITKNVMNVAAVSAKGFGEVVDEGKSYVTSRGLCWSTEQYPTVADCQVQSGSGMGSYEAAITSLSVGTTYYVRAFATNGVGTSYGDQVAITTLNGLPQVMTELVGNVLPTSAYHQWYGHRKLHQFLDRITVEYHLLCAGIRLECEWGGVWRATQFYHVERFACGDHCECDTDWQWHRRMWR